VIAVQVGIDVLHDVDVLPAVGCQQRRSTRETATRAAPDRLSLISLISFTSVFMLVVGDI
jgi:hypothetical protein